MDALAPLAVQSQSHAVHRLLVLFELLLTLPLAFTYARTLAAASTQNEGAALDQLPNMLSPSLLPR